MFTDEVQSLQPQLRLKRHLFRLVTATGMFCVLALGIFGKVLASRYSGYTVLSPRNTVLHSRGYPSPYAFR